MIALAGAAVEWYIGAGEYCPECGEALTLRDPVPAEPSLPALAGAVQQLPTAVPTPSIGADVEIPTLRLYRRRARRTMPPRWLWLLAGALIRARRRALRTTPQRWLRIGAGALVATVAVVYAAHGNLAGDRTPNNTIVAGCPIPGAQHLAADLLRGNATTSALPASQFGLMDASDCDVRFSMVAELPDDVIARGGVAIVNPLNTSISPTQLREIFRGSIHYWSELGGGPPSAIVPILPDAASDVARALASSFFLGVAIDRRVWRGGLTADDIGAVAGPDRVSRCAIGLVAFKQAGSAKVLPLACIQAPTVATIASRRYPFTPSIALQFVSRRKAVAEGVKGGPQAERRGP